MNNDWWQRQDDEKWQTTVSDGQRKKSDLDRQEARSKMNNDWGQRQDDEKWQTTVNDGQRRKCSTDKETWQKTTAGTTA